MAFDLTKLCRVGSDLAAGSVKRWDYQSSDTVTGAGYFPTTSGIKDGDIVTKIVITKTEGLITAYTNPAYYIKADADGVLTATLLPVDASEVAATEVTVSTTGLTVLTGSTLQALITALDATLVGINAAIDGLAAADVSFDATGLTHITGTTVQAALASVDSQLGS